LLHRSGNYCSVEYLQRRQATTLGCPPSAPAEPGSVVTVEGEKVGKLTSFTETDQGPFGLAYIRTKAGGVGLKVQVAEVEGEIVDVPFLTHDFTNYSLLLATLWL
jgi:folate-binding Fe-S cluster repair protein YgfZ